MSLYVKTRKIPAVAGIVFFFLLIGIIALYLVMVTPQSSGLLPDSQNSLHNVTSKALPEQTDIDNAQHLFDENGVPFLRVKNLGDVRNPSWVALYALEYAGTETYSQETAVEKNFWKFQNCVRWLKENMQMIPEEPVTWYHKFNTTFVHAPQFSAFGQASGTEALRESYIRGKTGNPEDPIRAQQYVWIYGFDNTYNDVPIRAPWYSAFGQATGIEALLESYNETGNPDDLTRARQAAEILFTPIDQGGLLYRKGDDIWFEEVPEPRDNPPHILNGHMRTLIALKKLYTATGDMRYISYYRQGLSTLERWLPLFDNGYWLRYDLNPKKTELGFRFTNPYGYNLTPLAIDSISLADPKTGEMIILDVGNSTDADGEIRIAGNDWGQRDTLDGRTIRRLMPVPPSTYEEDLSGSFNPPATYFYLALPSAWKDNLQSDALEMTVRYKDELPENVLVQMRSVAPGPAFRNLRDGDLFLTGSGQWREWKIPLRTTDLGYWVGMPYAEKHTHYLETLGRDSALITQWAVVAKGYENLEKNFSMDALHIVQLEPVKMPQQSPPVSIYQMDSLGVLMHYIADNQSSGINSTLMRRDNNPRNGYPVYSPYLSSAQILYGPDIVIPGTHLNFKESDISRKSALLWVLNDTNYRIVNDTVIYEYNFSNTYNDVISPAPWQSAFGQASVIEACEYAIDTRMYDDAVLRKHLLKCLLAYDVNSRNSGLQSISRNNQIFFEEVPQKTHILNADILSINQLDQAQYYVQNETVSLLGKQALANLKNVFYLYDAGYWLKYDQNPKKEFLFQIDWISGNSSPLIDEIILENPQTLNSTYIDVGSQGINSSYPSISGADWKPREFAEGKSVRGFENGYLKRSVKVPGGTQHNVFFLLPLPDRNVTDGFDLSPHKVIIRYKDISVGEFSLKIQAINEGNSLVFVPLQNGKITCNGDQQWKTATILLRPQDMGWYVGPDYQRYHVDQLYELANRTGDWSVRQSAEKQEYYLKARENYAPVVITPVTKNQIVMANIAKGAFVVTSSPMRQNHTIQNLVDGNQTSDFAEADEGPLPYNFTLDLGKPSDIYSINLVWENDTSFGSTYKISGVIDDREVPVVNQVNTTGMHQTINLPAPVNVQKIRFELYDTQGPKRLFLRQFQLIGEKRIEPLPQYRDFAGNASIVSSSPAYPGNGIENALDGDPNDDYTAFLETPLPQNFTLRLNHAYLVSFINITWESDLNFGKDYSLEFFDARGNVKKEAEYSNQSGKYQDISFPDPVDASEIRFNLSRVNGQPRLLMRQFQLFGEKRVERLSQYREVAKNAGIISSSPAYPGYGIENMLDGDPNDDYTAFLETPLPQNFTINLNRSYRVSSINVTWESDLNFGKDYSLEFLDARGNIQVVAECWDQSGKYQDISLPDPIEASGIRFNLYKVNGQPRLLMRQFQVWAEM